MSTADPREIIAKSPMGRPQIVVVILCILLNALDGFDVLAISFAAPGIAAEWGIDRAALGLVLSMELIGMAVGSVLLGHVADRVGRRPTILACLCVMSLGMYLASIMADVVSLSVVRLCTGFGIGGMLATTNAMVAEFSNLRHRPLAVSLMAAGYPLGAIAGGSIVSILLAHFSWHSVFLFGAVVTVVFIPLVWFLLPESVDFLVAKKPASALEKVNKVLQRLGHQAVSALPTIKAEHSRTGVTELFSPALARITILLTVAYFMHIMTFYYILKWIPKLVVDMGFEASSAGGVLVWANVGGMAGALLLSVLTRKFNVRYLVIAAMALAFCMVTLFGFSPSDLQKLSMYSALAGFFTNSAVVGLYAIFANSFPARVRAGGTGLVIGIGRGGAALGPIVAGFLFASGQSLPVVSVCMAAGSLVAVVALLALPKERSATADSGDEAATAS